MNKHHIYILKSIKDKKNYTGYTSDLGRRLHEHDKGMVKSTKNRRPLKLIHTESFNTKKEALEKEKHLKTRQGRRELERIIKNI
ncbi:MAG: GIY-YIG nuclease family protein [Nitrospirota bacterium]